MAAMKSYFTPPAADAPKSDAGKPGPQAGVPGSDPLSRQVTELRGHIERIADILMDHRTRIENLEKRLPKGSN
jgi:hypothetical protein